MSENTKPYCLVCKQDSDTVPVITLTYQDKELWICPSHLPMLIHSPKELIGQFPGAENLTAHK